jgi:hypothetical protein
VTVASATPTARVEDPEMTSSHHPSEDRYTAPVIVSPAEPVQIILSLVGAQCLENIGVQP